MRLNAWLARAGVASRRGADELIKAGRVTVNGELGQLNTFVASRDRVELDGRPLAKQRLAYVLLHKPAGVVTTAHDPQGRPTVVDLVGHEARVVPVGRLDSDTTGVLLLTNDGELAHRLGHPRYEVDKVYVAEVDGDPSDAALRTLEQGVELDDGFDGAGRGASSRSRPRGVDRSRGPHPPGKADARRCRPPGEEPASVALRSARRRRSRFRRMARAHSRRGGGASSCGGAVSRTGVSIVACQRVSQFPDRSGPSTSALGAEERFSARVQDENGGCRRDDHGD